MKTPVKSIIICGGGSAGWMSAAVLAKQHPDIDICLVEDPDTPTVGVGESTLGTINSYLDLLEIEEKDWMEYCQATYKLGIKFTDFYKKDDAYYYPFGMKDTQNTTSGGTDWYVKKSLNPETPTNDFYESYYSCMPFIYDSKIYDNQDGQLPGFSFKADVAYHMDATAFGQFLKNRVAIPNGVVHVEAHIDSIHRDHEGYVDHIKLDNGDELTADLFVDCTGFRSLLLEETMEQPFESFRNWLPNDRAWAVHLPYDDKEIEMENVTNCTAYNNGWVWNIPLYNRIGSGYVYDSKMYTSDKEALEDYKAYLNSDRVKFPKADRLKDEDFNLIKIKNGIHKKCWDRNVVGVGLSYGFIEPLESTGLLSVQEILLRLSETLHYEQINKLHLDHFNHVIRSIMEGFKTFVTYHYALSSRRDTAFWRFFGEELNIDTRLEDPRLYEMPSTVAEMASRMLQSHDLPLDFAFGGLPDIFIGNRCIPANLTQLKVFENIVRSRGEEPPEIYTKQTQDYWDQKKEYINGLASEAPSHYQYLKENRYNGNE